MPYIKSTNPGAVAKREKRGDGRVGTIGTPKALNMSGWPQQKQITKTPPREKPYRYTPPATMNVSPLNRTRWKEFDAQFGIQGDQLTKGHSPRSVGILIGRLITEINSLTPHANDDAEVRTRIANLKAINETLKHQRMSKNKYL